jgi:hypothetical protein
LAQSRRNQNLFEFRSLVGGESSNWRPARADVPTNQLHRLLHHTRSGADRQGQSHRAQQFLGRLATVDVAGPMCFVDFDDEFRSIVAGRRDAPFAPNMRAAAISLSWPISTDIANYFITLKNSHKQIDNLRVEILAVELDVWATTTGQGWSTAPGGSSSYGIKQDSFGNGTGTIVINVGSNGAAFGVADNSWQTVNQLLSLANSRWSQIINNASWMNMANVVFNYINEHGDIV